MKKKITERNVHVKQAIQGLEDIAMQGALSDLEKSILNNLKALNSLQGDLDPETQKKLDALTGAVTADGDVDNKEDAEQIEKIKNAAEKEKPGEEEQDPNTISLSQGENNLKDLLVKSGVPGSEVKNILIILQQDLEANGLKIREEVEFFKELRDIILEARKATGLRRDGTPIDPDNPPINRKARNAFGSGVSQVLADPKTPTVKRIKDLMGKNRALTSMLFGVKNRLELEEIISVILNISDENLKPNDIVIAVKNVAAKYGTAVKLGRGGSSKKGVDNVPPERGHVRMNTIMNLVSGSSTKKLAVRKAIQNFLSSTKNDKLKNIKLKNPEKRASSPTQMGLPGLTENKKRKVVIKYGKPKAKKKKS